LVPVPVTTKGLAPTVTAVYSAMGPQNLLDVAHFPKMGVVEIRDENSDT
jgi:hypothetical protein